MTPTEEPASARQPLALSPCPGCGYDYGATTIGDALEIVRDEVPVTGARIVGAPSLRRRRPAPDVWSPLEYGAHLRDVVIAQRERVILALLEEAPHFAQLHRDERATLLRYNEEDAEQVAAGLAVNGRLLCRLGGTLTTAQLRRTCTYDLPAPTPVDVEWVFVHTAHEVRHHLGDIERGLSDPRGPAG